MTTRAEQLATIPESISREQYLDMLRSLGLDPEMLTGLVFQPNGVLVSVLARHPDARPSRLIDGTHAVHTIWIPVTA